MLGYITMGTDDLDRAREFYSSLLGTIGASELMRMSDIVVDERAKVDALHAKAVELGGSCEGPPGVRGDEGDQAFYASYFRDPDGNKLCAFRIGPA